MVTIALIELGMFRAGPLSSSGQHEGSRRQERSEGAR